MYVHQYSLVNVCTCQRIRCVYFNVSVCQDICVSVYCVMYTYQYELMYVRTCQCKGLNICGVCSCTRVLCVSRSSRTDCRPLPPPGRVVWGSLPATHVWTPGPTIIPENKGTSSKRCVERWTRFSNPVTSSPLFSGPLTPTLGSFFPSHPFVLRSPFVFGYRVTPPSSGRGSG